MVTFVLGALVAAATAADAPLRAGHDVPVPERTHHVAPEYPSSAKRAAVMGIVVLRVGVNEEGKPVAVDVLHGMPMLDAAAIEAVTQWRYQPTVVSGVARRVDVVEVIDMFPDEKARLEYFIAMLRNDEEPPTYRLLACERLRTLGIRNKSALSALRKAVDGPDDRIRVAARATLTALEEELK